MSAFTSTRPRSPSAASATAARVAGGLALAHVVLMLGGFSLERSTLLGASPAEVRRAFVEGSLARVVCELAEVIPGGDHVIVTGEVLEVEAEDDPGEPLIYHGGLFRRLDAEGR